MSVCARARARVRVCECLQAHMWTCTETLCTGMRLACVAPAVHADAGLRSLLDRHTVQLLELDSVALGAVEIVIHNL